MLSGEPSKAMVHKFHLNRTLSVVVLLFIFVPFVYAQIDEPTETLAAELLKAKAGPERDALLAARKSLVTRGLGRELIRQGNLLLLAGSYTLASDVYTVAQNVAEHIGDREGVATASLDLGTTLYFQGNYDQALERYRKARELFTSVGNQSEAAKALSGLALIYKEQQRNAEALKIFEEALKEFEALDDKEEIANTLNNIGAVHYAQGNYTAASKALLRSTQLEDNEDNTIRIADAFYMQGDYSQAAQYYQKSLKSFVASNNTGGVISALGGAANSFYYEGKYDEAFENYQKNLEIQQELKDYSGMAASLQGMGNVARARGDFAMALDSYLKSLTAAEESDVKVPTATTLGNIGLVRAMQGQAAAAHDYLRKSLAEFETTGDKVGMARMLAHTGNLHYSQGNYDAALESYRQSFVLREGMNDKTGQANLWLGIGTVLLAQKQFAPALEHYQKALAVFESGGNKDAAADALTKIADVYLAQSDFSQALTTSERAIALAKQIDSEVLWYAQTLAGKAQRSLNETETARQSFAEAMKIIESSNSQITAEGGGGRSALLPYLSVIELSIDSNRLAEAFEYTERARVRALLDLLARTSTRITNGLSPAELSEERKLVGEVTSLKLQLDREGQARAFDKARHEALSTRFHQAQANYESFRNRLYSDHPQVKVNRGELAPLKIDQARALIGDHQTALLEYIGTETNVYLFVLTLDQTSRPRIRNTIASNESQVVLKVYPLNTQSGVLVDLVSRFHQGLAGKNEAVQSESRALYDLLLKPAEEQLAKKTKLVIVPDGILWRLPFESLQTAENRYVIDEASVAYVPSLSSLRELRKIADSSRTKTAALLAFGNPSQSKDQLRGLAVTYGEKEIQISSGPDVEIQRMKAAFGDPKSRVFLGPDASEQKVRSETSPFRMRYFGAPVVLDGASPMYSSIVLGSGSDHDDGLLHSWEVMNLRAPAGLVVMSEASTMSEGVGSFGNAATAMFWSWFVAGSPATVINRWQVEPSGKTQLLTELAVRLRMRSGQSVNSKAEALRESALTLRRSREFQHPYYWSGFALIGSGK